MSKSGNGSGKVGVQSIPTASRKVVQSLKEIVNCPEPEIYAMLKECNMDPNDAVQRLLSQDTFHEVKRKKEKKKEMKETPDTRGRGFSTTTNRGSRGVVSRQDGRGGSTQLTSSESGVSRAKSSYKKENGGNDLSSYSTSASCVPGNNNINRHPISFSDCFAGENKAQTAGTVDVISSSSQPSPGFQPAWVRVPGQVSMADIVKMGRPRASVTHSSHNASASVASHQSVKHPLVPAPLPLESNDALDSYHQSASKVSEVIHEAGHHVSHDDWSLVDHPSVSGSSVLDPSATSEGYTDASILTNLPSDGVKRHLNAQSFDSEGTKGDTPVEDHTANFIGSASSRQVQEDGFENTSQFDDESYDNIDSYQSHGHTFECQEGNDGSSQLSVSNYSASPMEDAAIAVSSAAANFQQLSLQEELRAPTAEVNPVVKMPEHLEIATADCSHLSFGSFGSGLNATYGSFVSKPLTNNLDESSVPTNVTSSGHTENRNEYFADEQLLSTSDGDVASRTGAGNYDIPSSQPENVKQDTGETTHGHHYSFPTSMPSYPLDNSAQPNASFAYAHSNSQMNAPLSSVMEGYTNSLQGNLLASMVQPAREAEHPYSPFLATQSMPTKYSSGLSSISGPTSSLPEIAKPSVPHPTAQTLPGTNIATGPTLPQHLLHPYSQPSVPLNHFANMVGYPFLPPSYTYVPSAFQQAYAGNSTYHQSPAAVHNAGMKYTLSQYKNSVPVSSLPQPAALASAYGGFGSSANIPGSFPLNPSSTPASTTIGYDDVMSSQYKDSSNHFVPVQQNDNPVWVHGPASRSVQTIPPSTYYNFQGQSQQHNGYRQGQQSSQQHYGGLSYPNFYHAQVGVSQEHQQQTSNDGTLSGSQVQQTKQSHQMWQPNY